MRKPGFVFLMAFIALLIASNASAQISLTPSIKQVYLSRNDSIGLQFELRNSGTGRTCIELSTGQNDAYIKTDLSADQICLNESETTNTTLAIRTVNAPKGLHSITLLGQSGNGDTNAVVSVYAAEEPEIELVAYPNDICAGNEEQLNVLVRNNSNEFKQVQLQADNEMLLPFFKPSSLSLLPHQERYVKLVAAALPSLKGEEYTVSMYAITGDETVKETVELRIVDCEEEETGFSLKVPSGCISVEKEKDRKVFFSVKNEKEEEQLLEFSVSDELPVSLQTDSAWLEAGIERQFYFTVNIPSDSDVKDYNLSISVSNNGHSIEKGICIRPQKIHLAYVTVQGNDFGIAECGSAVFRILLENAGDFSERFQLSLVNDNNDSVNAVLSEKDVTVEKHGSKIIFVNVSALQEAELGDYKIELSVKTSSKTFKEELRFSIEGEEEPVEPELPELEIASYPSGITMDENSEKTIFVSIRNNSEETIEGISIKLSSLPVGVAVTSESEISLEAGEEQQLELILKAAAGKAGEYSISLRAKNNDYSATKAIRLIVEKEEPEEEAAEQQQAPAFAGFAGLFAAGGSALLGLVALVILVAVIVLIVKAVASPTQIKKEVWMKQ
ncbi:MAG: hypothetical protein Q8N60_05135 [Candidatus Diapherotrites archaeon]|nr:hypothetical protein [Candidatus Diapherotrites archaeon]